MLKSIAINEQIKEREELGRIGEFEWKISLEDIDLVMSQTNTSNELAAKALINNNLDIVNAIIDLTI